MEVTEVLRNHKDETLALVERLLSSAGIQGTFSLPEGEEKLSKVERACLETMKQDFDFGIVQIDDNAYELAYRMELQKDKTAGQSWEAIQERLLANKAALLKKAVELSQLTGNQEGKGACLIGVYENGELAIRQRSQEIVNAIVNNKGEIRLAYHPKAELEEEEDWAKAVEIIRAVKAAGYHVPAETSDRYKNGLIGASEAVMERDYVISLNRNDWRDAMLDCPDNISDRSSVQVVSFDPYKDFTCVNKTDAYCRFNYRGAVLWLRG